MLLPPRPVIRWPGKKPRSAPIPFARDPFVNTALLRLTPDARGLDRFWITSYNGAFGCMGLCVNETGEARAYPFKSWRHPGFYSAVQTAPDTLWLCGNLNAMVRLDLKSGRFDVFETGAPAALVFAGMAYDAPTGKLFTVAFPPPDTVAVTFDTRACKTVKVETLPTFDHYQRSSFENGDGTHSVELQCPGLTFARWDPRTDTVRTLQAAPELEAHGAGGLVYRTIAGSDGRRYLPGFGWYNPLKGKIEKGIRPSDDTVAWFERDETFAYGHKAGTSLIRRWNLKSGEVSDVGDYPGFGLGFMGTSLTRSGRLVGVSKDGLFTRINTATGELEMARRLPTDSVQPADCVIRIDSDRVLGTPFITQRFWETNLRTKAGFDCGAAAPGGGEILRVWNINKRVYMAAYTGGELMEYNPGEHPHYPENPRVVAKPLTGMRPVSEADDGRRIFYTCSHHYGHLGSVAVRYDTKTGMAFYKDNPLPDQQIISLCYDRASRSLLAGTTYDADCESAKPATTRTVLAQLDAETLEARRQAPGPEGAKRVQIVGPLGRGRWIGTCTGVFKGAWGHRWFVFDSGSFQTPGPEALQSLDGWGGKMAYAGKPGHVVLRAGARVELWDLRKSKRVSILADSEHVAHFFVQGRDVILWSAWDVFVLEDVL
jgi:hypothetical protein